MNMQKSSLNRRCSAEKKYLAFFCAASYPNDIASQVFPLGFYAFSSLRLFPDYSLAHSTLTVSLPPSVAGIHSRAVSLFLFLPSVSPPTLSLSPTLGVPEAASKELSYPRAAHTDFPPSSPFPSTTITPSSSTSSASSPPPVLTPSLVVTPPTRAPVYLSGHMV